MQSAYDEGTWTLLERVHARQLRRRIVVEYDQGPSVGTLWDRRHLKPI